ncbi:MAG: sporulation protein [Armatimonadetes bacterium]|nr:sporulation protein [Armatimonadota bacterium]
MGLFSKMGAAVGVGAASVDISIPHSEYHWSDTIQGTLFVKGGTTDQTASEIKVSVLEEWETRDSEGDSDYHQERHNERTVARDVSIPAGTTQEIPFEVTVPHAENFGHDWSVSSRICVARAADRHDKVRFKMLPPVAIMRAADALKAIAPFKPKHYINNKGTVHYDFAPPEDKKDTLDGVLLMLREDGDQVTGVFEINPQEQSIADRLKALMKKDRVKHDVSFDRNALLEAPEGEPPVEVVEKMRELLQPYL